MATLMSSSPTHERLLYANAVKQLNYSQVSRLEKIKICRRLIDSHYHPDPSAPVLNFLCPLISSEAPSIENSLEAQAVNAIHKYAVEEWILLKDSLLRHRRNSRLHSEASEAPTIPNGILIQAGVHFLHGSSELQTAVSTALYIIIEQARYLQDLRTLTWLCYAVSRAKASRSIILPLRTAIFSLLKAAISRERDNDRLASAAVALVSRALPSELVLVFERDIVQSIRSSPICFHNRFAPWVSLSEPSLPQAVQFLLRAYTRHPPQENEDCSSRKRSRWEAVRLDAREFFEALSHHLIHAMSDNGKLRPPDSQGFCHRMKAVRNLFLIGAENAAYFPLQDELQVPETKRAKLRKGEIQQFTKGTGLRIMIRQLIETNRSLHLTAQLNDDTVTTTIQAIDAAARFSLDAIDEQMSNLLLSFVRKKQLSGGITDISSTVELFCTLVRAYQQSKQLNRFLVHLVQSGSLHALSAVLKQKAMQSALGTAFSNLRKAEVEACMQALVSGRRLPVGEVPGLTLIYSLLLENGASTCIPQIAVGIAKQVENLIMKHPINPVLRQCRLHLASSFLIANNVNSFFTREEYVILAVLRLAALSGSEQAPGLNPSIRFEDTLMHELSTSTSTTSPAELCSTLRCLAVLAHYVCGNNDILDDRSIVTQVLEVTLARFSVLYRLFQKSESSEEDVYTSSALYDSVSCHLVVPWLGSLGNLLTKFSFFRKANTASALFLSEALQVFPTSHLFWNELCERAEWGPLVAEAACIVLQKHPNAAQCAKCLETCPISQVLASVSLMSKHFFAGTNSETLLRQILHFVTVSCCSNSRQHAIEAFQNLGITSLTQKQLFEITASEWIKVDERGCKQACRQITLVTRLLASQILGSGVSNVHRDLSSLLSRAIVEQKSAVEKDLGAVNSDPETYCEFIGALLELGTLLEPVARTTAGSDRAQLLNDVIACIKVGLPLCVKSFSKKSPIEALHTESTSYILSAMFTPTSPIYKKIFSNEECNDFHRALNIAFVPFLHHGHEWKQRQAILVLRKMSILEGKPQQAVCGFLLPVLETSLTRLRHQLPSMLKEETDYSVESMSNIVAMANGLVTACAQLFEESSLSPTSTLRVNDSCNPKRPESLVENCRFDAVVRILSGLEGFVNALYCALQEIPVGAMGISPASVLINDSDSLVCNSLDACGTILAAGRPPPRERLQQILLLIGQIAGDICTRESVFRNEGVISGQILRIHRMAVRRHAGMVPNAMHVIGTLLRRGMMTDNKVMIGVVCEALEDMCTISKTWEVLSALLADCSVALDKTVSVDSRRAVEKSTAFVFKNVGERRAQQVLTCLKDSGRDSLKQVWETFSDKLNYSGK